jgi:superfamily II DNA/RNA helicase
MMPHITARQTYMPFSELGLSQKVLDAVEKTGYTEPTPIQAAAIPLMLDKRDLIGIAQTGTGKTASFVLPMLTRLETGRARARMPRTLILEPTRELAAQVHENFKTYGINHKLTVALIIGGVSFDEQDKKIDRGADVLIATPGRLLDHFERGKLLLGSVDILVIDEADRMLDMGFIPDIERICRLVPPRRQTVLFSATMPPEIKRLTAQFLKNPESVEVAKPSSTAENVTQSIVSCGNSPADKRAALRDQMRAADPLDNAIVFCNRKRDVGTVQRSLVRHGFNAGGLHGDMDQHARMATLESFRSGETPVLVASDVAARGLDIPKVSHVFNYDLPSNPEDYVHRIGRTGRAGRSGVAISLLAPSDSKFLDQIERMLGRALPRDGKAAEPTAPADNKPSDDATEPRDRERGRSRGRRGRGRRKDQTTASETQPDQAAAATQSAEPVEAQRKPASSDKAEAAPSRRRGRGGSGQRRKDGGGAAAGGGTSSGGGVPFGQSDDVPAFLLRTALPREEAPEST